MGRGGLVLDRGPGIHRVIECVYDEGGRVSPLTGMTISGTTKPHGNHRTSIGRYCFTVEQECLSSDCNILE